MTFGDLRFQLTKLVPGVDPDVLDAAINNRLESIGRHLAWKALEADGVLSTVAAFQGQGTVAVTLGSNAIALTGAVFSAPMTGMRFRSLDRTESYIFTYVDATHGTLDRAYEGETDTAEPFILYQNIYALPADYGEPIRGINARLPAALDYWDRAELDESAAGRGCFLAEPVAWCEASRDTAGNRYAELFPAPSVAAGYPIRYRRKFTGYGPGDTALAIPDFISSRGLIAALRADLQGDAAQELIFQAELSSMRREDAATRGPQKIRLADSLTRHRVMRVLNNYRRHLP